MEVNSGPHGNLRPTTAFARAIWRQRRRFFVVFGIIAPLLMVSSVHILRTAQVASAAPTTKVSLTFDDGIANQLVGADILNRHNKKGTFYAITGSVGAPNYLTQDNLTTLAAAGHEIGGHTVTHPDLTTLPADEAKRQICNSRATLASWNFRVTSFAYPYAASTSREATYASQCGYNSARSLGDVFSKNDTPTTCSYCVSAETIPPADPYNIRAPEQFINTWTLTDLQNLVTKAETNGGGWVPITFHGVGGADQLSISPALLDSFLTWLDQRESLGTTVNTVDNVVGGAVKPVVTMPPSTNTNIQNASLETAGASSDPASPVFPQCWMPGGWGTNTVTWTRTNRINQAHTGRAAERLDITGYSSGDAKLLPQFDTGSCTPAVTPGKTYKLGTWYKSTGVAQYALYYRKASGAWAYWTSSPWFATASAWTQATWTTPPAPADAVGMNFGLALISNGTLTTDDYSFAASGTTAAPANLGIAASVQPAAVVQSSPVAATKQVVSKSRSRHKHGEWGTHDRPQVPGPGQAKFGQVFAVPTPPD